MYWDHVSWVGLDQSMDRSDALSIIQSVGPGAKLGEIILSIQLFLWATSYGNSPTRDQIASQLKVHSSP